MAVVTAVAGRASDIGSSLVSSGGSSPAAAASEGYLRPPVIVSTVSGIMARHQAEAEATAIPGSEPDAAALAASATPDAGPAQATFTYTIQPGDTIDSIAAAFGLDAAYIIWNNPLVDDPDLLLVGEALLIPSLNGIVYHVTLGDTLSDIAAVYQIDVQSIVGFVPNGLGSPDDVTEGMVLLLPGAVPPPAPIPAAVTIAEESSGGGGGGGGAPAISAPASSAGFAWPYYGPITTYFGEPRGSSYHKGIDIDGFGNWGAPIYAAAEGLVVLATWDDWGLGYHVVIEHNDGSRTVYGHMSEIWVSQGQYVGRGEAVGAIGSTGYSTGPHLHFEIWIGGVPVDPLYYLP
jgi:murein DD-endopeptidase MepM/ murein hydrolase activator NlpD